MAQFGRLAVFGVDQQRLGGRTLERQHGPALGAILQFHIEAPSVFLEPGPVLVAIGGIDHHQKLIGDVVDEDVIHNPAIGLTEQAIARLPDGNGGHVAGNDVLEERHSVGAANHKAAHMANVKQAGTLPHRVVLLDDPAILDRHLPAAELNHPRAGGAMGIEERGTFEHRASDYCSRSARTRRNNSRHATA